MSGPRQHPTGMKITGRAPLLLTLMAASAGISLTVNAVLDPDRISLFIIPETLRATTWGSKTAGTPVNVETDIVGKYIARQMQFR